MHNQCKLIFIFHLSSPEHVSFASRKLIRSDQLLSMRFYVSCWAFEPTFDILPQTSCASLVCIAYLSCTQTYHAICWFSLFFHVQSVWGKHDFCENHFRWSIRSNHEGMHWPHKHTNFMSLATLGWKVYWFLRLSHFIKVQNPQVEWEWTLLLFCGYNSLSR